MAEPRTLHHWIGVLDRHGDRPAVVQFARETVEQRSYHQIDRLIGRFARGLNEHEIGRDDRVAFLAPSSLSWVAACLGVLRAGAVPVPLDVQFSDEALVHVLHDSRPRLVITDARQAARLEKLELERRPDTILLSGRTDEKEEEEEEDEQENRNERDWRRLLAGDAVDPPSVEPGDEAVLFYTSGTTGPPKGVPLTHGNIAAQLEVLSGAVGLGEDDRVLLPLPLHHVYPFVVGMLTPLARGLPVVLPYSFTGPQIVRALREADITVVIGVPRLYRALYDGIRARAASRGRTAALGFRIATGLSSWLRRRLGIRAGKRLLHGLHRRFGPVLRVLACGGSPLDDDLAWKLEALGWQVAVGYGLTETSPLVTLYSPGEARIGTVGRVVPGVELRIDTTEAPGATDAAGRTIGEILVRGPSVFDGYRNLPEETEQAFTRDGWFRTGDLGFVDDEGFLHVSGRKGTMIVTEGGENVQPDEVEDSYAEHPAIREIGVLEDDGRLVGLVVPETSEVRDGGGGLGAKIREVVETRASRLPSYKRLSDFRLTREALPRTRLGKIQRHKLRERFEQAKDGRDRETAAPIPIEEMTSSDRALLDDPTARQAWDLLAGKYADRRLTPDTNLRLDLGVDSLEWLNLSLDIRREAGVELDEEAIGRIETVRELIEEAVEAATSRPPPEAGTLLDDPEAALSDEQQRHLRRHGPLASLFARGMFAVNRVFMRLVFRLEVEGVDRLPDAPVVIAPNHASYLDAPAIAAGLPAERLPTTFWGGWTGALFANPIMRWISRLGHVVPIDPERGIISSLAFGAAVLDRGHHLVWFPEGERSPDGRLGPFRGGIGLVLEHHPALVVPTAIRGTHEALPPGRRLPRPRKILVRFGEPLEVGDLKKGGRDEDEAHEQIAAALHDAVSSSLRLD